MNHFATKADRDTAVAELERRVDDAREQMLDAFAEFGGGSAEDRRATRSFELREEELALAWRRGYYAD
jgi:hypothetical protein